MYQASGLEGGGARRQAAFWGVGVSQLPPGLASVPLSRCSRGWMALPGSNSCSQALVR